MCAFHVTRWDVFGYKPCSGTTSPQRAGAGPRHRLSPCPKKPPFAAHEILARLALPLPPGSPGLWRARYNNARVAKTTREINSWLKKKEKEKAGGGQEKKSHSTVPSVGAKSEPASSLYQEPTLGLDQAGGENSSSSMLVATAGRCRRCPGRCW